MNRKTFFDNSKHALFGGRLTQQQVNGQDKCDKIAAEAKRFYNAIQRAI